jgi:hypothetical protein
MDAGGVLCCACGICEVGHYFSAVDDSVELGLGKCPGERDLRFSTSIGGYWVLTDVHELQGGRIVAMC